MSTAFSLTELMIVIAIVALISAAAIPNYKTYINKSKVAAMIAVVDPCKVSLYQEFMQTGSLPNQVACYGKLLGIPVLLKDGITASYAVSNGVATFTLNSDIKTDAGSTANLYIKFTVTDGDLVYSCGALGGSNPIPTKYLPTNCNTP